MIMKIRINRMTGMISGCALALIAGLPAIADDTELLLINPDPSLNPKPNVMFIMDTSGSMDSLEKTLAPYDSAVTYTGSCDINNIYWTDVDVTPVCDANQTQYISKSAFECDYASQQIAGVGTFTNTMVQYRSGASGSASWQYLEPGNSSDPVECNADSGLHGNGTAGDVYAASGSGLSNPWTSNADEEVSWGSAPRNLSYTVYDGNYLNWKASPVNVDMQRIDILKSVSTKVLSSVNNMNVGIMRFNEADGGAVIKAMTDLDTNRASILATIATLQPDGRTPLSETMYENALYWLGARAHYPNVPINENPTDPAALVSSGPQIYRQPALDVCAKNYNVLITDGLPNQDADTPALAPTLPLFSTVLSGRTACNGAGEGRCLDDVSEYLANVDTDAINTGTQTVTTHTIGFSIDLPILRDTALASGGQYFLADDVETLTVALLEILANINDGSQSFSAPAVSVNTFNRTQNLNDVYMTMFGVRSRAHWPGNLKKYKITNITTVVNGTTVITPTITDADGNSAVDPSTGFFYDTTRSYWTAGGDDGNDVLLGGAANDLPVPASRSLYTNNGSDDTLSAASNAITPSNAAAFQAADFGLTGATGEPTVDEIIRWMRGEDVRDEDGNAATTVRNAMGDPLHSQPAAIIYGGTALNPDVTVYTVTNDGYLHALNGATGEEIWSYVPKDLLLNMTRLYFDPAAKYKQYGIDGNIVPVVKDANNNGIVDGSDFVYIIFGKRRGGSDYTAIDVTNRNAPELMWNVTLADAGQSWSTPVVARMDINVGGLNSDKAVVVIGGGYDSVHDTSTHPSAPDAVGAGLHILDLVSGATLWRAGPTGSGAELEIAKMTRSLPNETRVIDTSGDGFADRMYASDLGGQILRFDISKGATPAQLVAGGVIAQLGAEGVGPATAANTRRFYNAPDASLFTDNIQDRRFIAISIGSGYREHPFDLSAADQFYSIRDKDIFNQLSQIDYDNYDITTEADLVEVSGQTQVTIGPTDHGWKFTLPLNEKVLADSLTFDDSVLFVSFTPDSVAAASCSAGRGTNFLYRVSVINGDPIVNNLDALDPNDADDARREQLAQGGIAPTPAILFPSSDDPQCTGAACAPPPLGCVGVECFDPGFVNNPVRTLWTQDGIE
jgi:type IV pilus assembly protein PilY1